jgi:hypothetical protein
MKPNPTIREIVAKGYLRGWLKPPANPVEDLDALVKRQKALVQSERARKRKEQFMEPVTGRS